jgi:PAS domain S-box-containing protein
MAAELRNTGISIVGDVPWGTHFCSFYETKQDLLDILIPFFKTGLERHEFCFWIISDSELLTMQEAKGAFREVLPDLDQHLDERSIEFAGHDWFLNRGSFDFRWVATQFKQKVDEVLGSGHVGMRVNGSPAWLETSNPQELRKFEAEVDQLFPHERIIASCTYPIGSSSADFLLDVARHHRFAIARRKGIWDVVETPELRQAKAEIERLNADLERRVVERTKELEATTARLRAEIEERKEAEGAVRQSQERFAAFMDNLPGYAWMKDLQGRYVYINGMVSRLPGYESLGKTDAQIWPADLAAQYRANDEQVIATKRPLQTVEHFQQGGKQRYMVGSKFPIFDKNGAVALVGGVGVDITERVEAEAALRESEAKLQQAQQLAHIGYWERDLVADRITWSKETGHILGLESFRGVPNQAQLLEFIHPDDRRRHQQIFSEALQGSRLFDVEVRFVRPDGDIRFVHVRDEIVRDESGQPIRMFGAVQDVTERRRAEEAVRRSEEHLRLVIDTIPAMAWSTRPDGVVDFLNQRWLDYAGLTMEQYLKDPVGPIHPDDVPRVLEKWQGRMAMGEAYEDEMRLRRADGEYRWFLVRTEPLRDERGNLVKWYGSSTDIEDRKQAEEKLRHSEVQLAQAQRLAHVGSWDWDLRTNKVAWSDELYRIFGLEPGTIMVAGDAMSFIHPDDQDLVWSTVKNAVAKKERYGFYYRALRPDGTERIVHSRGAVLTDDHGEPIRVFGATQDVTELKHAEEKLKETTEQLRALSASVQTAREEESKRIAREIHDELGGALTSWRWDLEEIHDEMSTTLDTSQVATVRNKIEGMIKLTETTLDTVRRLASELRPTALELGLVQGLEWQALQFENRTGIPVQLECVVETIHVDNGQATAVFRILQEALTNIQRHAHATSVTITCWEESGRFFLTIKDNGRGITESEKSDRQSLGLLGMRERAHLAGGGINIESTEGEGTKITLQVPISEPEQSGNVGPRDGEASSDAV